MLHLECNKYFSILPKKEIITETEGRKLKLSNLNKILYPDLGIMKAEVIQYYLNIARYIFGYRPFIKASGSKGLHIYVSIIPIYERSEVLESVKALAKKYIRSDKSTILKMNKEKRKGRVLLDIYRLEPVYSCELRYASMTNNKTYRKSVFLNIQKSSKISKL